MPESLCALRHSGIRDLEKADPGTAFLRSDHFGPFRGRVLDIHVLLRREMRGREKGGQTRCVGRLREDEATFADGSADSAKGAESGV